LDISNPGDSLRARGTSIETGSLQIGVDVNLKDFHQTRVYDRLSAAPIMLYLTFAAAGLLIQSASTFKRAYTIGSLPEALQAVSFLAVLAFVTVQLVLFFVRHLPERFSEDWLSRSVAILSSNGGFIFLLLPKASLSPATQIISSILAILGAVACIYVVIHLGRAFSILPQARRLRTTGPYRYIRHPLYLAEQVASLGVMLQFKQPWSLLMWTAGFALQIYRMHFEERLLSNAYPAYREYAEHTARLIPGIY
jgi:protein-S-isoprenylcysteine O-methyltransferase Ste14